MSDAFKGLVQEAKTEYDGEKPEVSAEPVKSDMKSEEADETDRIPLAPATTRLFDFKNLTLAGYVFNTYIITQRGITCLFWISMRHTNEFCTKSWFANTIPVRTCRRIS